MKAAFINETGPAEKIKRKIPSESSQTKNPKRKFPSECFKATDLKRKFPSDISKRRFSSEGSQINRSLPR